jgi:Arc/MetJ-type ribon-helix-helix transcriptional regulator
MEVQMKRILVRLPDDVREWLREQCSKNASSHSSEVVRALRERMRSEKDD